MRGTFESAQSTQNVVSLFGTENVTFPNNADGGGGEVAATNGVRATFSLFQISKGPITHFHFLNLSFEKGPKKGPRWQSSVNSQNLDSRWTNRKAGGTL